MKPPLNDPISRLAEELKALSAHIERLGADNARLQQENQQLRLKLLQKPAAMPNYEGAEDE
jgi:regulator of replication initiation timing